MLAPPDPGGRRFLPPGSRAADPDQRIEALLTHTSAGRREFSKKKTLRYSEWFAVSPPDASGAVDQVRGAGRPRGPSRARRLYSELELPPWLARWWAMSYGEFLAGNAVSSRLGMTSHLAPRGRMRRTRPITWRAATSLPARPASKKPRRTIRLDHQDRQRIPLTAPPRRICSRVFHRACRAAAFAEAGHHRRGARTFRPSAESRGRHVLVASPRDGQIARLRQRQQPPGSRPTSAIPRRRTPCGETRAVQPLQSPRPHCRFAHDICGAAV